MPSTSTSLQDSLLGNAPRAKHWVWPSCKHAIIDTVKVWSLCGIFVCFLRGTEPPASPAAQAVKLGKMSFVFAAMNTLAEYLKDSQNFPTKTGESLVKSASRRLLWALKTPIIFVTAGGFAYDQLADRRLQQGLADMDVSSSWQQSLSLLIKLAGLTGLWYVSQTIIKKTEFYKWCKSEEQSKSWWPNTQVERYQGITFNLIFWAALTTFLQTSVPDEMFWSTVVTTGVVCANDLSNFSHNVARKWFGFEVNPPALTAERGDEEQAGFRPKTLS